MEQIFNRQTKSTFKRGDISEYFLNNNNILNNDYFEGEKKFNFEEIINFLQTQKTELIEFSLSEKHIAEMEPYEKSNKFLMLSQLKTDFIINRNEEMKYKSALIKEIYDFYLESYFNHLKSKQLLTLKFNSEDEQTTKNYFIKILNMDFSLGTLLNSVIECEKTIKLELNKLIESNLNFIYDI